MHADGSLDVLVVVLLGGSVALELLVELVEIHLYLGSTGELESFACAHLVGVPLVIVLSGDGVFVGLDEISDHVPEELHLLVVLAGHGCSEVSEIVLAFLLLLSNFLHDIWQTVLDMGEEDSGEFGGQVADS